MLPRDQASATRDDAVEMRSRRGRNTGTAQARVASSRTAATRHVTARLCPTREHNRHNHNKWYQIEAHDGARNSAADDRRVGAARPVRDAALDLIRHRALLWRHPAPTSSPLPPSTSEARSKPARHAARGKLTGTLTSMRIGRHSVGLAVGDNATEPCCSSRPISSFPSFRARPGEGAAPLLLSMLSSINWRASAGANRRRPPRDILTPFYTA